MIDAAPLLPKSQVAGLRVTAPSVMVDPDRRVYQLWKEDFTARFKKPPLYTHAFAYDMATILADTRARLPERCPPEDLFSALRATYREGLTGPLRFDADGDLAVPVELAVVQVGVVKRSLLDYAP